MMNTLRWYATHENLGSGRVIGDTYRLVKAGYVRVVHTMPRAWVATITEAGRAALAKAQP